MEEQKSDDFIMTGDVEQLPKNIRYKLLMVRGDYYLLDMDRNPLLFIFPFLNWFFTHEIYQLDTETAERMREVKKKDSKGAAIASVLGIGGVAFTLGKLTPSFVDRLTIGTPMVVNIIIFLITLIPVFYFRFLIKERNKSKMEHAVSLKASNKFQVQVKSKPWTPVLVFLFSYLFFWVFAIGGVLFFFIYGNIFTLLVGVVFIFLMFLINHLAFRPGKVKVTCIE